MANPLEAAQRRMVEEQIILTPDFLGSVEEELLLAFEALEGAEAETRRLMRDFYELQALYEKEPHPSVYPYQGSDHSRGDLTRLYQRSNRVALQHKARTRMVKLQFQRCARRLLLARAYQGLQAETNEGRASA